MFLSLTDFAHLVIIIHFAREKKQKHGPRSKYCPAKKASRYHSISSYFCCPLRAFAGSLKFSYGQSCRFLLSKHEKKGWF